MRRSLWIGFIVPLVLAPMIAARAEPAHRAPTPRLGRQPSLFDSPKQGSSSHETDYGQRIEDIRSVVVESTIKSYEFWIGAFCLGLNVALFFYVLYLDTVRRQAIRSTARLVAVYQSHLATGQRSYQRLDEQRNKSVTEFEQEKEPRISSRPPAQKGRSNDDAKTNAAEPRAASPNARSNIVGQAGPLPETPLATPPEDEKVVNMRQQITTLTHQLEQERQKNRKLRGE